MNEKSKITLQPLNGVAETMIDEPLEIVLFIRNTPVLNSYYAGLADEEIISILNSRYRYILASVRVTYLDEEKVARNLPLLMKGMFILNGMIGRYMPECRIRNFN